MGRLRGNVAMTVAMLVATSISAACATSRVKNPRPVVRATKTDDLIPRKKADVAIIDNDDRRARQPSAALSATESTRSSEDIVQSPDPYGVDGTDWLAREEPDETKVRELNARHGLLCSERSGRVGCVDRRGHVAVPFVYIEVTYFAESGLALAVHPDKGRVYIDTKNRLIGRAETIEGWPDEALGGHARFRAANGKIGYLDRSRRLAIPAQYDAAFAFRNGRALVCVGCHPQRWSSFAPEEAACTGRAFIINESGVELEPSSGTDWERCQEKTSATQSSP
jgi:hypothetical protein